MFLVGLGEGGCWGGGVLVLQKDGQNFVFNLLYLRSAQVKCKGLGRSILGANAWVLNGLLGSQSKALGLGAGYEWGLQGGLAIIVQQAF